MKKLRRKFRSYISKYPKIYIPLARHVRKRGNNILSKSTEMVVEGFPRSGNSFVEAALIFSQKRELVLGHHTHTAAHVILAVKQSVPCLVLIRAPREAARSLIMLAPDTIDAKMALREYITFYETIEPFRYGFVIGEFNILTKSFGAIIEELNTKFEMDYLDFDHTKENVLEIFTILDNLSTLRGNAPDGVEQYSLLATVEMKNAREKKKLEIDKQFDDLDLAPLLNKCERIYENYCKTL